MKGYIYILLCGDGSYYSGSTTNLELRLDEHQRGEGANHTRKHLPVKLVYFEEFSRIDDAFYREKQIQGWSRSKKEALIKGDKNKLKELSKSHSQKITSTGSVNEHSEVETTLPSTGSGTDVTKDPESPKLVPSTGSGTDVTKDPESPKLVPSTGSGTDVTKDPESPKLVPSTGSGTGDIDIDATVPSTGSGTDVTKDSESPKLVPSTGSGTGFTDDSESTRPVAELVEGPVSPTTPPVAELVDGG